MKTWKYKIFIIDLIRSIYSLRIFFTSFHSSAIWFSPVGKLYLFQKCYELFLSTLSSNRFHNHHRNYLRLLKSPGSPLGNSVDNLKLKFKISMCVILYLLQNDLIPNITSNIKCFWTPSFKFFQQKPTPFPLILLMVSSYHRKAGQSYWFQ